MSRPSHGKTSSPFAGAIRRRTRRDDRPGMKSLENEEAGRVTDAAVAGQLPLPHRLALFAFGGLAIAALLALRFVTPDSRGVGTHEQLGLLPCFTHALTGFPCPFCGMTTAVTHVARGQWAEAFLVQPAGALIGLAVVPAAAACMLMAFAGRYPSWMRAPTLHRWGLRAGVAVVLLAWFHKLLFAP